MYGEYVATNSEREAGNGTRRATITFPGNTGAVVDELTARRDLSLTALVRRAVTAYKHLDDAELRGARVLIQEPGGLVKELVFVL